MQAELQEVLADINPYHSVSVEETFIPLETHSQGNTPVVPSDTEFQKGKGKMNSESLIPNKEWIPIATQRIGKPQGSASIKGKPTLIMFKWRITMINPVVTSKGKYSKEVDKNVYKVESKVNTLRK
ncbi:hypothetical protein O181_039418 [Austropuccinia psidii MF-1]|uniref:Uncharacterized protein n=1 Tax=Austropuccinia psidii MF-1 TaxID=1389203 RepID=A0A9Q3HBY8_9BASI|nr:hypothetical protein [Austropuccinia psidii MF-1]